MTHDLPSRLSAAAQEAAELWPKIQPSMQCIQTCLLAGSQSAWTETTHPEGLENVAGSAFCKADNMPGCNAQGTEPMQDGLLKPNLLTDCWVNMQRIAISIQSVQGGLIKGGLLPLDLVWLSAGHFDAGSSMVVGIADGAAKATGTSDIIRELIDADDRSSGCISGDELHDSHSSFAFISNMDQACCCGELGRMREGPMYMQSVLAMEQVGLAHPAAVSACTLSRCFHGNNRASLG